MEKILIIGAGGQIGTELADALISRYGYEQVICAEPETIRTPHGAGQQWEKLDVLNKTGLHALVIKHKITTIYHMAAMLSATAERHPLIGWELNVQGLLHVLDIAKTNNLKVFWPSSIAVFGEGAPKLNCPQDAVTRPGTVYGISKVAGELWCRYYFEQYGVDVRSIRYPGLISYKAKPGGGTTDYAIDIFHQAIENRQFNCYLKLHTTLPMMYMPDAIRATLAIMDAPMCSIKVRGSYNIAGVSFNPEQLAVGIKKYLPAFEMFSRPDYRQEIAESWPGSVNDLPAQYDWGWKHQYTLDDMTKDMLYHLNKAFRK